MWDKNKTVKAVKALMVKRSNTNNPYDWNPDYRVLWSEVFALMKEHGFVGNVIDARWAWDEATKKIRWPK